MKKTLHLYIFREISTPFVLGIVTFTSVLLMGRLLRLADMVVSKGVPLTDILRLVVYLLPFFGLVTIPMAFLLAILLAFGRLSSDSEITAMKTSGASIYSLMPPVLFFAVLAYGATAFITIKALPWGNVAFKELVYEMAESGAELALKERVFVDTFPGLVIYVDRYDRNQKLMSGIMIQDDRNPSDPSTIFAQQGTIAVSKDRTIRLHLAQGTIHRLIRTTGYRLVQFQDYNLEINLPQPEKKVEKNELDMTFDELRSGMASPANDPRMKRDILLEFHRRFALPFACLVFALVGVPLGIQNQRSGKAAGFSLSIGVILIYYILFSIGRSLGEKGLIHPAIAVWTPNILFTLLGVQMLRSTAAERRMRLFSLAADLGGKIRRKFRVGSHRP